MIFFSFNSQIVLLRERVIIWNLEKKMSSSNIILTFLIIKMRVITRIWFLIEKFKFFIDNISLFILPFSISLLNSLDKYSGTILMIVVILLKSKHLIGILFMLIPPLQILLQIDHILNILIENIDRCSFLFHYLVDFIRIEVCLRRRIFVI